MKMAKLRIHKLFVLVALVLIVIGLIACNLPFISKNTNSNPVSQSQDCLARIKPGKATRAETISLLGEPAGIEDYNGLEVLYYNASIGGQFNSVVLQNGTVVKVSVILGEKDANEWSAIKEEYGDPEHIAFSYYLQNSMTYIYAKRGLAFVADEMSDVIFIRECFESMKLDEYLETWGTELPNEDPFIE